MLENPWVLLGSGFSELREPVGSRFPTAENPWVLLGPRFSSARETMGSRFPTNENPLGSFGFRVLLVREPTKNPPGSQLLGIQLGTRVLGTRYHCARESLRMVGQKYDLLNAV